MDSSKLFIIGANGQLGTALKEKYPNARFADQDELDITNRDSVANYNWSETKVILNAAAYTNVDSAETLEGRVLAWNVNATALSYLVDVARKNNITLVHISSDYVFDGTKDLHDEDELLSPLNVYGASKAAGDLIVSSLEKYYILRTSWVIGEGKNFVRTMTSLAEKNISPTVVHDQIGRLTFTSTLVEAINFLLNNNADFGTYNVTNDGEPASWADITREIFKLLKKENLVVTNTTTSEYFASKEGVAPRPLFSTLGLDKIKQVGFLPKTWQEDLNNYIKNN